MEIKNLLSGIGLSLVGVGLVGSVALVGRSALEGPAGEEIFDTHLAHVEERISNVPLGCALSGFSLEDCVPYRQLESEVNAIVSGIGRGYHMHNPRCDIEETNLGNYGLSCSGSPRPGTWDALESAEGVPPFRRF